MRNILSSYFEGKSNINMTQGPVITISRECGCSAKRIATKLSKILTGYSYLSDTKTNVEWRWVSKEIIEQAAIELELDTEKIKNVFLGEAKTSLHEVTSAFSTEKMYDADDQKVIDAVKNIVLRIAEEGHYIIVGRAAGIIARGVPGNVNIKLQAPLEWRVNCIMQISNMTYADAQSYVLEIDRQRELFVEHIAGRKLNNSDFDMIFNYATMLDDHIVDAVISVLKNKKLIIHAEEDY
jgi:cytidylate kinase